MPKIPNVLTCLGVEASLQRTSFLSGGSLTSDLTLCPPQPAYWCSGSGGSLTPDLTLCPPQPAYWCSGSGGSLTSDFVSACLGLLDLAAGDIGACSTPYTTKHPIAKL